MTTSRVWPEEMQRRLGTVGRPFAYHRLTIVDADGRPQRIDKAFSWEAPLAAHGLLLARVRPHRPELDQREELSAEAGPYVPRAALETTTSRS